MQADRIQNSIAIAAAPNESWNRLERVAMMKSSFASFRFPLAAVCFLAALFLGTPNMVKAGDRDPEFARLVKAADLVVVARVVGPIDAKPIARTRPHREAHWIQVERTLQGYDETGHRLRVRPNPLPWQDGKSYVLFLQWLGGDWVQAIPQELVEANDRSIATVASVVAALGGGVHSMRALWIRHSGGWGAGVSSEFLATVDGTFEWKKRIGSSGGAAVEYERRSGKLPEETLKNLVARVAEAGQGPAADDYGEVSIQWLDANGEVRSKNYFRPDRPPVSDLLEAVEALARQFGQAPCPPVLDR